ncbi:hypothetical protein FRB93_003065 [Tulasnella sp. JGI-2019a]|nr:hypothetical protein FRB93_003065 [Tulasnella sp. JGI-2019a]
MAQSLATQEIPSMKSSPITLEYLRGVAKDMENGHMARVHQECIDENVEWTFSPPADGPLGKTHPIAGTEGRTPLFVQWPHRPSRYRCLFFPRSGYQRCLGAFVHPIRRASAQV